jgi:signal transduction histidine kinase
MISTDLIDRLVAHRTLGTAPREELAWLAAHGSLRQLAAGEVVSRMGEPVAALFVVLSGRIAIHLDRGTGRRKLLEWRGGDVTGMLPYSRLVGPPADSVAQEPTEVLVVPNAELPALIRQCEAITTILVHVMLDRSRQFTSVSLQDEKMASLGKLSAGIAHELNNPAAAIERSASLLDERLDEVDAAVRLLGSSSLTEEQFAAVDAVRVSCLTSRSPGVLSPLQQAERENMIDDWLAGHGVKSDVATPLSETAVNIEALEQVARVLSGAQLDAALRWVAAGCSARALASEIQDAATRISGLVSAVKGFTYMDQATVAEPVDLTRSLSDTVAVLNAKAKSKAASVRVLIDPDVPRVRGFGGELNQIWANLIDNALDAIADGGGVDVTARRDRDRVIVQVIDNGPGIPDDIRERLFDPFFTTKPIGKGTGLGLDIVRRLVAHNDGVIELETVPGRTEFRVTLPVAEITETMDTGEQTRTAGR